MFWLEFGFILLCILIGSRVGGIGLGAFSGFGLVVFTFVFHVEPTSPPIDVLLMILAVITAVCVMQSAGGLNYLVYVAEKALRKRPSWITFIAPLVAYLFTFMSGTGHTVYALLPVISEVSREAGIRPERPLSISVIAAQQAITACPISAATVSLLALLSPFGINLGDILMVCVPSTLIGCMVGALVVNKLGKELNDDPVYQKKMLEGAIQSLKKSDVMDPSSLSKARISVGLFLIGTISIVVLGAFSHLRPFWEIAGQIRPLSMPLAIEMIMLCVAAAIMCLNVDFSDAANGSVAKAGFIAVVSIFGIAWLGDTFVAGNSDFINDSIGSLVTQYPALFAIALFVLSILLYSQAATVLALMPLGVALKIPVPFLIAMFPAVNGYFFLPTYGTILAAIAFDQTGSTKIGKYVLNHSFMIPGMVATTVSIMTGFLLSQLLIGF